MDKILIALIGLLLVFIALLIYAYYQRPSLQKKVQIKEDLNEYYSIEHLENKSKGVFKLFYVDWCGHCQNFKPIFEGELSDAVRNEQLPCRLEMVNCEENPEEAKKYNIRGYPTMVFQNENNDVIEYQGERTANAIIKFLKNMIN
jgi:thiol-disulfide isomerase/thioredoxin